MRRAYKALLRFVFHFGYLFRIVEVKTPEQKKAFHSLWTLIWTDEKYAHAGEPLPKIEGHYAVFNSYSTDLVLCFGHVPIGTIRLIWENKEVGIPVLNDFEVERVWNGRVVEATLLTLKKEWRGRFHHLPSLIIWRELYRRAKKEKVDGIVMAADIRVFRLLQKFFPFQQIGKERFYEGSTTVPAYLSLKMADEVVTKTHPILARFFLA
jgi:hypothetical protein